MARGQGFEPQLPGPKPGVLPLDDPRLIKYYKCTNQWSPHADDGVNHRLLRGKLPFRRFIPQNAGSLNK